MVHDATGKTLWWTFAGWKANLWLAAVASAAGLRDSVNRLDDLAINLDPGADTDILRSALRDARPEDLVLAPWITAEAIDGLKFADCLPRQRATELAVSRLADAPSVAAAQRERLGSAVLAP